MGSTGSESEEVAFVEVGHHADPPPPWSPMSLPRDQPDSVVWTFLNTSGHRIECVVRFAMGEVQVEILSDGSPLISRLFQSGAEATAWSEAERDAWSSEQ